MSVSLALSRIKPDRVLLRKFGGQNRGRPAKSRHP
jgi:hypothetical protein